MINWRDPDGRPFRRVAPLSAVRWTTAIMLVTVAHAGGAWMALNWRSASEAAGEPPPAVMIELAPLAVAPEAPPEDVAPGPQMTQAEKEPEPEKPVEEEEKPEPEPSPEPPKETETKPPEVPKVEKAEVVLPPKIEPPRKKPKPKKKKQIAAPRTTAPPTSQAQRADHAAAPFASASRNPSMSPATWRGSLVAHLNRYKRFPPGTAGTGVATVAFTIDRAGRVLSSRLVRSSGDSALDAEAVSLARRASPVPAPPPNVGGRGSITLAVPIRFTR